MKSLIFFFVLFTIPGLGIAAPPEDAIKASQRWQVALANAVTDLVKRGEKDPIRIAALAMEKTQPEEKRVREAGRALGASIKDLDKSIQRDRDSGLDKYIKNALTRGNNQIAKLKREGGLSVYLVPKQVVDADPQKRVRSSFIMSTPKDGRALFSKPAAQSAKVLIAYLRRQPETVQQNGIWLVTPDTSDISETDKRLIDDLKHACQRERIPLFIASVLKISEGWKRFSQIYGSRKTGAETDS